MPRENQRSQYNSSLQSAWLGLRPLMLAILASFGITLAVAPASGSDHPNIVFILADDMGYGDPQCYNPQSGCVTPAIDSLCQRGMKFTDAHAAGSLCHPSRFGLLTGRYPNFYSMDWRTAPLIKSEMDTVPQLLTRAGYQTRMVGKWHLGFDDGPNYKWQAGLTGGPVDRGFQSYFGIPASTDIPPYYYIKDRQASPPPTQFIAANNTPGWSRIQGEFWREGLIAKGMSLADVLDRFGRESVASVNELSDKQAPYFLYVALAAPHTPWLPAAKYSGSGHAGMYSEFVAHVDAVVGQIVAAVNSSDEADNTIVIFSSDNGPTWYPVDVEKYDHDAAGGLRGMKGDAWEAGHRVPFLVRWPKKVAGGTVTDELISFIDLLPTIAELTDTPVLKGQAINGVSFANLLDGPKLKAEKKEPRVMLVHHSGQAIRHGKWKLINGLGSLGFSKPSRVKPEPNGPRGQLYNLEADPTESNNVWQSEPQRRKAMLQLLNMHP